MDWLLPLLGGLGIGSLITNVITHFMRARSEKIQRMYHEKREAYLGLLQALHRAAVTPSDQNSKEFALWQTRVQLFGPKDVAEAVQGIVDTNDGPRTERDRFMRLTIDLMRRDLNN